MKDNVFRIDWNTGFIEAKADEFFIEADVRKIKKLYKLGRQYSTEEERIALMDALVREDKKRKDLLDKLGELEHKLSELSNSFYHTAFEPKQGWAAKRLIKERVKLAKAINLLAEERWF